MKTVLVVAATLGLSASAAFADCAWHNKTSAEVKVDKTITTASVTPRKSSPACLHWPGCASRPVLTVNHIAATQARG